MRKLRFAPLLLFALVLALAAPAAAQETPVEQFPAVERVLERAFSPYIAVLEHTAALLTGYQPLPACTELDSSNLRVANLEGAVTLGAVFCREINSGGEYLINPGIIGNQSIIERGVQQAYDVFGMTTEGVAVQQFNQPVTVCLRGRGELFYLPAFASPRPAQMPASYPSAGFTCTQVGSSGILALVNP